MISLHLYCYNGHEYDAWFADHASYDKLQTLNLLACPTCGICDVKKADVQPDSV